MALPNINQREYDKFDVSDPSNPKVRTVSTDIPLALKYTESGTVTYVGQAAPGTAEATTKWQCFKFDSSTGKITWADSGNYSQAATDLTALTYA